MVYVRVGMHHAVPHRDQHRPGNIRMFVAGLSTDPAGPSPTIWVA
jgi:hypothetical protein